MHLILTCVKDNFFRNCAGHKKAIILDLTLHRKELFCMLLFCNMGMHEILHLQAYCHAGACDVGVCLLEISDASTLKLI